MEFRTKQMINSMLIFSILVVIIFNFAFNDLLNDPDNDISAVEDFMEYLSAGILWITFIFTGMLGLSRSFNAEKDKNCIEGLMLCPNPRGAIYLGKVISNLVLIFIVEVVTILIFIVFFNYNFMDKLPLMIPVFLLGTTGFVIVGALLSAISMNTRNREVLLPLLLFPIILPIIISSVTATGQVFTGASFTDISDSIRLLAGYDVFFMVIALFTFDFVIEE